MKISGAPSWNFNRNFPLKSDLLLGKSKKSKDVEYGTVWQEKRESPQRRSTDVAKEEVERIGVTGEDGSSCSAMQSIKSVAV